MTEPMIGVVLLNLGGPESEEEIPLFLRRLLSDPDVVPIPWPIRPLLARVIAHQRKDRVVHHYRAIGGKSPIGEQTRAQVQAIQARLGNGYLVRHVFRHSAPWARDVVRELSNLEVRRLIALPAYPQWSRSTTGSALADLEQAAKGCSLAVRAVRSYPAAPGWIEALRSLLFPLLEDGTHVIFSAHGLPARSIRRGDPYVGEVQETAAALAALLPRGTGHSLAFQSRLGPVEWTRPYLTDELCRLGTAGCRAVVVVPVSFVCENLETRYELDSETAEWARQCGISSYHRVPTPGCHPAFIEELALQVQRTTREAGWEKKHGE